MGDGVRYILSSENFANLIAGIMYFEKKNSIIDLIKNIKFELEIRLENFLDWKLAWTIISFSSFPEIRAGTDGHKMKKKKSLTLHITTAEGMEIDPIN